MTARLLSSPHQHRSTDGVNAYMTADHQRLDALLVDAAGHVERGELALAAQVHRRLRSGIERHIKLEEQIVFPLFEQLSGHHGPVEMMHREHRMIEVALAAIASTLDARDGVAFRTHREDLVAVLDPHHRKQEAVIYPTIDDQLDEAERRRINAALREFETSQG